jgi:hypothetical protein
MELLFEVPKQRQDSTRHQTATKEKKTVQQLGR